MLLSTNVVRSILALTSVAVVVGCSSPAPTEVGAEGNEVASTDRNTKGNSNSAADGGALEAGSSADGGAVPGKGTSDGGTSTGGGTGDACKASSNGQKDACSTCCEGSNGEAYRAADDAYAACACAPAACAAQCGAYCGSKNNGDIDATCGACLKSQSQCATQADAACAADATCSGVDACLDTCIGTPPGK